MRYRSDADVVADQLLLQLTRLMILPQGAGVEGNREVVPSPSADRMHCWLLSPVAMVIGEGGG